MWYAANLLFRSSRNPRGSYEPLWEESIRLISAESENEARRIAETLGRSERATYQSEDGVVSWEFECIERIYIVGDTVPGDGSELFSRHLRDSEAVSILKPFDND